MTPTLITRSLDASFEGDGMEMLLNIAKSFLSSWTGDFDENLHLTPFSVTNTMFFND